MEPAADSDAFTPGTVVDGKYRVERRLGKGGMGVVVEATHLALGTRVALKCLRTEAAASPTLIKRFLREARAAAQLQHEHICRVLDVGYVDDTPFLVMELLDGMDLGALARRGPLDIATAVDYVRQACVGLAVAHERKIVHRDLKPENLFLCRRPDGSALIKLVDFGVAKAPDRQVLTGSIQMIGSPAYMSPEQMRSSRDVDARTDVWALGVILYRLVSGRLPFPGASVSEVALQILDEPPAPLDGVPPAFAAIVMQCLEKEPADRYAGVDDLARALRPFGTEIYSDGPGDTATVSVVASPPALSGPTDVVRPRDAPSAFELAQPDTDITRPRSDVVTAVAEPTPSIITPTTLHARPAVPETPNPRAAKQFDAPPLPTITGQRMLPPSRKRWAAALGAVLALGLVVAGWIVLRSPASAPATDPANRGTAAPATDPTNGSIAPATDTASRGSGAPATGTANRGSGAPVTDTASVRTVAPTTGTANRGSGAPATNTASVRTVAPATGTASRGSTDTANSSGAPATDSASRRTVAPATSSRKHKRDRGEQPADTLPAPTDKEIGRSRI